MQKAMQTEENDQSEILSLAPILVETEKKEDAGAIEKGITEIDVLLSCWE